MIISSVQVAIKVFVLRFSSKPVLTPKSFAVQALVYWTTFRHRPPNQLILYMWHIYNTGIVLLLCVMYLSWIENMLTVAKNRSASNIVQAFQNIMY